jgi:hypothetical protein
MGRFFLFFVQKTARFSFVARLNVIGFVGLVGQPNATLLGLTCKPDQNRF